MSLKPATKIVSSFSGIVVVSIVLWLLLNLVYAPSCGKYGCSYEPAWWPPAAAADSCPDTLRDAATNSEWAAEIHGNLRTYGTGDTDEDTRRTWGRLFYGTGSRAGDHRLFRSGESDTDDKSAIDPLFTEAEKLLGAGHPAASHAETKAAVYTRQNDHQLGVMVINHPGGPCQGVLSCRIAIPKVLPTGSELVVWWNQDGTMHRLSIPGEA